MDIYYEYEDWFLATPQNRWDMSGILMGFHEILMAYLENNGIIRLAPPQFHRWKFVEGCFSGATCQFQWQFKGSTDYHGL